MPRVSRLVAAGGRTQQSHGRLPIRAAGEAQRKGRYKGGATASFDDEDGVSQDAMTDRPLRQIIDGNHKFHMFKASQTIQLVARMIRRVQHRMTLFRFVDEFIVVRRMMERLNRIIIYGFFMVVFTISTVYAFQEQDLYHMARNLKGQLTSTEFEEQDSGIKKTFADIETIAEVHQWLRGPFARTLYSGSTLWVENYVESPNPRPGAIFGFNTIVGGVRVAQLRMELQARDSCTRVLSKLFRSSATSSLGDLEQNTTVVDASTGTDLLQTSGALCVGVDGDYQQDEESKQPAGGFDWAGPQGNDSELYHTVQEERNPFGIGASNGGGIRGPTGTTYPAPAFPVVLPNRNYSASLQMLESLEESRYFDLQTKVFRVDFTVYNPHLDKFHAVCVVFEANRGGGLEKGYYHSTATLHSPFESNDWLTVTCELITAAFFAWFIVEEIWLHRKYGYSHFAKAETIMHIVNIMCYVAVWSFRIMAMGTSPDLDEVVASSGVYYGYVIPVRWKHAAVQINAINAVLAWMKIAKAMTIIPQFQTVLGTLARSFRAAVPFIIVFGVFVYSFASSYLLVFGSQLGDYRNIGFASWSLFKTILGDFELDSLASASYFLGPLLAVSFVALALFVILNMLVAIVLDSYQEEVMELKRNPQHPVMPFLSAYVNLGVYHVCGLECRRWFRDQEQSCGRIVGLRCSRRHQVLIELMCTPAGVVPELPAAEAASLQAAESESSRKRARTDGTPAPSPKASSPRQPRGISDALVSVLETLTEEQRAEVLGKLTSHLGSSHGKSGADTSGAADAGEARPAEGPWTRSLEGQRGVSRHGVTPPGATVVKVGSASNGK